VETSEVWNFAGKFCSAFGKQGFGQGCFTGVFSVTVPNEFCRHAARPARKDQLSDLPISCRDSSMILPFGVMRRAGSAMSNSFSKLFLILHRDG